MRYRAEPVSERTRVGAQRFEVRFTGKRPIERFDRQIWISGHQKLRNHFPYKVPPPHLKYNTLLIAWANDVKKPLFVYFKLNENDPTKIETTEKVSM